MSLRGAQRRGNPFPLCGAVRGGVRIATPACAPVRNDTGFWGCGACRRRGVVTPPYGGWARGCGAGGSSGKSAKRRRWRRKRADFEEVPRLATTTVDGNRLARWWAIAAPYENSNVPCAPPLRVRGMIGRRHTRVPPYGGYESAVHIHEIVIPRSAATWQSVPLMRCRARGSTDCHTGVRAGSQ